MIAVLREDGRRVQVAEHHTRFSRTWQKMVTDYVVTTSGEHIEGWQILRFEPPEPEPAMRSHLADATLAEYLTRYAPKPEP